MVSMRSLPSSKVGIVLLGELTERIMVFEHFCERGCSPDADPSSAGSLEKKSIGLGMTRAIASI